MRSVLASDLGIWPVLAGQHRVSDAMLSSPTIRSKIANYLLLYDQVVIPTGNFQILPVLRLVLGDDVLDDLLKSNAIVFARYDQWFGYAGNGRGIVFFSIFDDPTNPKPPNIFKSFFLSTDQAVDVAIAITNPPSSPERHTSLRNLIMDNTVVLPLGRITHNLKEESYHDILNSPYLRNMMALRNAGRSLNNLVGLGPDQLTVYDAHLPPEKKAVPEIRSVLQVAFENFVLGIREYVQTPEIAGDNTTLSIIKAKGQRLGFAIEGAKAFTRIQELHGVPDIGSAFANNELPAQKILALRYSKYSQAFRDWFSKGSLTDNADDIVRRFVEELGSPSLIERLPARILRFAVPTIAGLWQPHVGAAMQAADGLFLSRWFSGRSPRLFLKQAKLMLERQKEIPVPKKRKVGRNVQCPCSSGMKYKKCCGRM